jgi:hypothetical protein
MTDKMCILFFRKVVLQHFRYPRLTIHLPSSISTIGHVIGNFVIPMHYQQLDFASFHPLYRYHFQPIREMHIFQIMSKFVHS